MPTVELERLGPERRGLLSNLYQLYVHDFGDILRDGEQGELEETGLFPDYIGVTGYLTEPDRQAWLIRAAGRPAGFVLIDVASHSGHAVDHNMGEFFVVRKHRRSGVGLAAAAAVIRARPGVWEIAVRRGNAAALAFWRRVVADLGVAAETLDAPDWNGCILRFRLTH